MKACAFISSIRIFFMSTSFFSTTHLSSSLACRPSSNSALVFFCASLAQLKRFLSSIVFWLCSASSSCCSFHLHVVSCNCSTIMTMCSIPARLRLGSFFAVGWLDPLTTGNVAVGRLGSLTNVNVAVGARISTTGRAWSGSALSSAVSPVLGSSFGVAVSAMTSRGFP